MENKQLYSSGEAFEPIVDGAISIIKDGGNIGVTLQKKNALSPMFIATATDNSLKVDKSSTSTYTISQYDIVKGNTYNVNIPKTGNQYVYVWGYTNDLLTSAIEATTSIDGMCPSAVKGTTAAMVLDIVNNTNYKYLIVCYNSSGGEPTITTTKTVNGLYSDEADIAELQDELDVLKGSVKQYAEKSCGVDGVIGRASTLSSGQGVRLDSYPFSNNVGERYQFYGKFDTFSKLKIGKGIYKTSPLGFGDRYNCWLEIDNEKVSFYRYTDSGLQTAEEFVHGLTLDKFININMQFDFDDMKMHLKLHTYNSSQSNSHKEIEIENWLGFANGYVQAITEGDMIDVVLSATNKYLKSPFWIFGASFEQCGSTSNWQYYLRELGYCNYLCNSYGGRGSVSTYEELIRALQLACPKYLYWTMWGNGSASDLDLYIGKVKEICEEKGITLIIIDRPNSSSSDISSTYTDRKAVIEKYKALGVRYVNAAQALSTNPSSADGWYDGYLSSDGKHPAAKGAEALAMRVLVDIPEIMQY